MLMVFEMPLISKVRSFSSLSSEHKTSNMNISFHLGDS